MRPCSVGGKWSEEYICENYFSTFFRDHETFRCYYFTFSRRGHYENSPLTRPRNTTFYDQVQQKLPFVKMIPFPLFLYPYYACKISPFPRVVVFALRTNVISVAPCKYSSRGSIIIWWMKLAVEQRSTYICIIIDTPGFRLSMLTSTEMLILFLDGIMWYPPPPIFTTSYIRHVHKIRLFDIITNVKHCIYIIIFHTYVFLHYFFMYI